MDLLVMEKETGTHKPVKLVLAVLLVNTLLQYALDLVLWIIVVVQIVVVRLESILVVAQELHPRSLRTVVSVAALVIPVITYLKPARVRPPPTRMNA